MEDLAAFTYFRWVSNGLCFELYKERYEDKLLFRIKLPFIAVTNTVICKRAFDGHGGFKYIPVTTGKVLWWEVGKKYFKLKEVGR